VYKRVSGHLMIMKQIIFSTFILSTYFLVGCQEKVPVNKIKGDTNIKINKTDFKPNDCKIVEIRATTDKSEYNIVRLDFICMDSIVVKSFNLLRENPYSEMDFPVIDESTDFFKVSKNYKDLRKYGNIDFNLKDQNISKIYNEIPHKLDLGLSETKPFLAVTRCNVKTINSYKVIVNYYISLYGFTDSLKKKKGVVFLGGNLEVLNSKGEKEYQICAENYAITHAQIDPTYHFLTFRTTEMINSKGKDGFQIHDLTNRELFYQIEFDTSKLLNRIVYDSCNYVLFQVSKKQNHFRELFLFDMNEKIIYKKIIPESYKYSNPFFVNDYVVFSKYISSSEKEEIYIYDTLKIAQLKTNDR